MPETPPNTPPTPDDDSPYKRDERPPASELVQKLIAEYGSADAALHAVAKERWTDRERVRVAEGNLEHLKGKVAKGRLLSSDEAKELDSYKALNLAPDAVKQLQTRTAELEAKEAERTEEERWTTAAALAEFTKPKRLRKLAELEGFKVDVTDEQEDGQSVRRAYAIVGEGDKVERVPLASFIEERFPDDVVALRTSDEKAGTVATAPTSNAPKYPAQQPKAAAPQSKIKTTEQLKEEKRASGMYAA